jgi:hypothetical protein
MDNAAVTCRPDSFGDLEGQVCKLKAMVEILVLIRGEKESREKAEQMFLAIEHLELLMQGFVADYTNLLERSLEPLGCEPA